jgi:hypothetical protein
MMYVDHLHTTLWSEHPNNLVTARMEEQADWFRRCTANSDRQYTVEFFKITDAKDGLDNVTESEPGAGGDRAHAQDRCGAPTAEVRIDGCLVCSRCCACALFSGRLIGALGLGEHIAAFERAM